MMNENICLYDDDRRSGFERRVNNAKGIFANSVKDLRKSERRIKTESERKIMQSNSNAKSVERIISATIGFFLIFIGIISILTDVTFFPLAGTATGVMIAVTGLLFIYAAIPGKAIIYWY